MTTIACRDGVIACDSMEGVRSDGGGDRYYLNSDKIYPVYVDEDGAEVLHCFIGCSGDSDGMPLFVEWFTEYYDTDLCDKQILKRLYDFDVDALILYDDGRIETGSSYGIVHPCKEPFYAIGSGTKAALAAMHMGADAKKAVEIASLVDPHTGGPIQVFKFHD